MIRKKISEKNIIPIAFLLGLTVIFFYKIFLHLDQMIYPAYDLGIYSAWKTFFVNSFYEYGKFPLWNPYLFSGSTFVGSGQSAMFYPFNILYLIFSIEKMFGYMFILDFFLFGLFTYLYCRTIKLDGFSSIVAAVCAEFNGVLVLQLFARHIFIVDGIVWFPLLLLLLEKSLQKNTLHYGILAGIPLALMLLSGNGQIAVYGSTAAFIYFIFRYITVPRKIKLLLVPFVSIAVGLGLSAIQLLPSNEFSKLSIRVNGIDISFASSFSLYPKQIIGFILPHFFGSPLNSTYWGKGNFESNSGFFGIFPLIIAFVALSQLFKNKYIMPFAILTLFSLFFSFGNSSPFYLLFHHFIPWFNLFRVPSRFLYIYAFSISILAGIGIQFALAKSEKIFLKKLITGLAILLFLSLCILMFLTLNKNSFSYFEKYILKNSYAVGINHKILFTQIANDLYSLTISILISTLIFLLIIKTRIPVQLSKTFIIVFIFLNFFLFGSRFYDTKNPTEVFRNPSEVDVIKKDHGKYRTFDMSGYFVSFLPRNFIQSATGYDAIYLKNYRDFLWQLGPHENTPFESFFQFHSIYNPQILKLLNVKYVLSKKSINNPDLKLIYKDAYYLYALLDFLPRAYIVGAATIVPNKKAQLAKLSKTTFEYKNEVILEKDPNSPLKNNSSFMPIPIKSYAPDKISLSLQLENSGYLVLSEIWYPGWKAFDNRQEKEIYKANYLFRSVYLVKGKHNITFIYDPKSYKIGKAITISSILLISYLVLKNRCQQKKKRKTNFYLCL